MPNPTPKLTAAFDVEEISRATGIPPVTVETLYWLRRAGFTIELLTKLWKIKNGKLVPRNDRSR